MKQYQPTSSVASIQSGIYSKKTTHPNATFSSASAKQTTEKENIKYADSELMSKQPQVVVRPQNYAEDEILVGKHSQQITLNNNTLQSAPVNQQKQIAVEKTKPPTAVPLASASVQFKEDTASYQQVQQQPLVGNFVVQDEQYEVAAPDADETNEPTFEEMMNQIDQEHDSEDEGISDYKIGGYHPVHIGEVINKRYVIIQKIGWGHFSTVWLAKDFKYETYVALKIQKSAPHYMEAAFDEVEILQKVAQKAKEPMWMKTLQHYYEGEKKASFTKDDCQVVQLLNSFVYKGPYGNHFCFVFEILGVNLLEVIKRYNYQGVPMHLCRKIARQVLIGLDFLHRFCQVIHTDLKPENVLLQLTNDEIADIIHNGQMTKNQLFKERLQVIRKHLGVAEEVVAPVEVVVVQPMCVPSEVVTKSHNSNEGESEDEGDDNGDEDDDNSNVKELEAKLKNDKNLTKKQKKTLRKKINKKKRRIIETKLPKEVNDAEQANPVVAPEAPVSVTAEQQPTNVKNLFSQMDTKLLDKSKLMRGPQLDSNFKLKIADLGNACWTFHHFATEIQTRQYRSPEVITGSKYNTTADVWSLACMLFEMLTGDFLFEPRKGPTFSKNDDHLAQIQELCRKFPKGFAKRGERSKKYFDHQGNLRRIPQLQYWPLKSVLVEKYKIKEKEALAFEDFMMKMLHCMPEKRWTADQMLEHPWLKGSTDEYEYKMTETEISEYLKRKQKLIDIAKLQGEQYVDPAQEQSEVLEDDIYDGDGEVSQNEDDLFADDDSFYDHKPDINMKLVDRSFTNLGYIGYGDGIDLDALDNTGNWQFQNI